MKIFVAGFQHETNTFAPTPADWPAFEAGSAYPVARRGAAMLELMAPGSLPIGGFIRAAHRRGHRLLPSLWAGAAPSAHVTREAFERICAEIVEDASQGGFDAIYLDLHGAAVAEHADDAEGELMQRLRAVVGPAMPLVASLDLHANVTARMATMASAMVAFRTYPHVDMATTGERALTLLQTLHAGTPLAQHRLRVPFLLPLNAQCTLLEPAAGVMQHLHALEAQHGVVLSFAMGFPAADFDECGPLVFGYGADARATRTAVTALHDAVMQRRGAWGMDLLSPAAAVRKALVLADQPGAAGGPVVIADTQDNPGAGGDANTTGMLHALIDAHAGRQWPGRVALGLLCDPEAAGAAHAAGVGHTLQLQLGRQVPTFDGSVSDPPVRGRFRVAAVSDGVVPLHGPMTAGSTLRLGLSACVEVDGIRVLLVSAKSQMLDLDLYRFLGIEPAAMKVLVNKSSVHFRAAFGPIASHILVAKAAGPMAADPADLPWRRLPAGIARRP